MRRTGDKGQWIGGCIAVCSGIGIAVGAIIDPDRIYFWGLLGLGSGVVVGVLISAILASHRPDSPDPPAA